MHVCIYTYIHTYIHTCIHTSYIYTYIHTQAGCVVGDETCMWVSDSLRVYRKEAVHPLLVHLFPLHSLKFKQQPSVTSAPPMMTYFEALSDFARQNLGVLIRSRPNFSVTYPPKTSENFRFWRV